jgi:hypothetical protein
LPFVRLAAPKKHEAVGVAKRDRVEDDPIDDGEHGRRPADPDGEGEHRGRGEAGRSHQPAGGMAEVCDHARDR